MSWKSLKGWRWPYVWPLTQARAGALEQRRRLSGSVQLKPQLAKRVDVTPTTDGLEVKLSLGAPYAFTDESQLLELHGEA
ncbi:hypothetical protein [Tessaracoccus sp.]